MVCKARDFRFNHADLKPENLSVFRDCFPPTLGQNSVMTPRRLLFALWLLAWFGAAPVRAAVFQEFYVSPAGADANPGTKNKPFQTLTRAQSAVRDVNRFMNGDIIINVRGGNYPVTAP